MTQQSLREGTSLDVMNSLKGHVEANAIMGEDDSVHKRLSDKFALNAMGEIVCGKVTPMTDAEAMASSDWHQHWRPSLKLEFDSLHKLGTFEPVRRSEMIKLGR